MVQKVLSQLKERQKMNKNICFMKWWLLNAIIILIGFICWQFNLFHEIYQKDSSYLCFVIMIIFCFISAYNGNLAYNIEGKEVVEKLELTWFASEICLALGMIGTVIGFIQMLAGFSSLNISNVNNIQSLMVSLSYGMSTALYTTLVGLIFGNILKIQAFDIERTINLKKECNEQQEKL